MVQKVVHLFRNPFDNLVSRKHLGVQIRQRDENKWNMKGEVIATDTAEGLLAWCKYIDDSIIDHAIGWSRYPEEFQQLFRSIPCAADLFRYVQWHNRAIETTRKMQVPVHYLYYEDYSRSYQDTVLGLLDFLELNLTRAGFDAALPFNAGNKSYQGLFRHRNFSRTAMRTFLRRLASDETWRHIRQYVETWYDEESDQQSESNIKM